MICDWLTDWLTDRLTDWLTDAFNWKYPLDGSRMLNSSHNRRSKNSPLPLALTPSSRLSRIGRHSRRPTPPPCSENYSSVIRRSPAPWRCLRARPFIVSCLREGIYSVGSLRYIAKQQSKWPWPVLEIRPWRPPPARRYIESCLRYSRFMPSILYTYRKETVKMAVTRIRDRSYVRRRVIMSRYRTWFLRD